MKTEAQPRVPQRRDSLSHGASQEHALPRDARDLALQTCLARAVHAFSRAVSDVENKADTSC